MKILRKGAVGQEVSMLQNILRNKGFPIYADGIFGMQTHVSVCLFQKQANLTADGIVGSDTWKALNVGTPDNKPGTEPQQPTGKTIDQSTQVIDFKKAADVLNIEEAAIRAVHQVEAAGRNGFLPDGRPMILFEGHIFWSQLKKLNIAPEKYVEGNENILFPKWNRNLYKGGAAEHERLKRAVDINRQAALCSASWGMFQIMGFNHRLCGYDTVDMYVEAMEDSSNAQLMSFIHFLQNAGMDIPLRNLDWMKFASLYNGPCYAQNQYDKKLKEAYQKIKETI